MVRVRVRSSVIKYGSEHLQSDRSAGHVKKCVDTSKSASVSIFKKMHFQENANTVCVCLCVCVLDIKRVFQNHLT